MVEQMRSSASSGPRIPEEHGGLDLDVLTYARLVEELAYGWMSLSGVLNTHTIVANLIKRFGTDEQRAQLAAGAWPPARSGAPSRCPSPTPAATPQALRCKATPDGDEYIVNGTKMWVTNGERAERRGPGGQDARGHHLLHRREGAGPEFEGISVSRTIDKLGYKGLETVEMAYDGHRIPADTVLGGAGQPRARAAPRSSARSSWAGSTSPPAPSASAGPRSTPRMAYAQQRETFGVPIAKHQAIQFKLADMATKLQAARLLVKNAAEKFEAGERADVEAGMAKLFCSETALEIATECMRIHGGIRLHGRVPGRALLPGRPADDHRRGHQRDPTDRHRPRPAPTSGGGRARPLILGRA